MSWRKHIIPLFIAHSLSVYVRFVLLGALSALSLLWFGVFFVFHGFAIFYYVVIRGVLLNLAQNRGSCWNPTENILRLTEILASSLFSFVEFFLFKEKKWRMTIYYWVPFVENVMLGIICLSMVQTPLALRLSIGVALIVSAKLLYICEKFKLESKNSKLMNPVHVKDEVVHLNETSEMGLSRRRRPPLKEWKDVNELLSDGDLGDEEKNAIRRKDFYWICRYMQRHLFQVLTLMLAENGTDLNEYSSTNPIAELCSSYDKKDLPEILELLINNGADVKAVDRFDNTMLHLVCQRYKQDNMKDVVDLLIKSGAPVDTKNKDGYTALHLLARYYKHSNMKDVVELLIDKGVPVDAKNGFGDTALHKLAKVAKVKAVEARKSTILHFLCQCYTHNNMKDVVDLLINAGVPVDAKDYFGNTALDLLVEYYEHDNMKDVVDLLIKSGVPVEAKNEDGYTALHCLAENYQHDNIKDIVDLLIKAGVQMNAKDIFGNTALHLLAENYKHDNMKDVVDLLIKSGVPVDAKNEDGYTALLLLARYYKHDNMKDVVDLLIKSGATVDAKNKWEETALHYLVKYYEHDSMKDVVDLLIKGGVPVDAKNEGGNTALHLIAKYYKHDNLEDIVRLLKDNGARLDVQNKRGLTPFMELCRNEFKLKHLGVFSLLTPEASDDPLLSDTIEVTRLLEEFDKKKIISPKNLEDRLKQIREDVKEKCRKQK